MTENQIKRGSLTVYRPLAAPLDVDNILDFGAACHLVGYSHTRNLPDGKLAARLLNEFEELRREAVGTEDRIYLTGAHGVVVLLGLALGTMPALFGSALSSGFVLRYVRGIPMVQTVGGHHVAPVAGHGTAALDVGHHSS